MKRLISILCLWCLNATAQESAAPVVDPVIFEIPKMMCGGCTGRVSKLLQAQPGVSDVSVTLDDKTAKFICKTDAGCDLQKIKKDLARIQFPAREKN